MDGPDCHSRKTKSSKAEPYGSLASPLSAGRERLWIREIQVVFPYHSDVLGITVKRGLLSEIPLPRLP